MISKAKENLSEEKFSFEVVDFDTFKNYESYDFIFSNMSLHWSENFSIFFISTKPNALWWFIGFFNPNLNKV